MANTYESCDRVKEKGALYLVEDRAQTFVGSNWPFESGPCTPLKMAEAGFYYCGSAQTPDWVRCAVCHQDMEGWEESDNPRDEHKRCQPGCDYLKLKDPYTITVGDILDLEKAAYEHYIRQEGDKLSADLDEMVGDMREQLVNAEKTRTS
uniref:Survivin-like n=1 Tax=Suberites domuncula TaxID=55567 RepID=E0WCW1_SUBDO|nr:survivin-like [Suberites domuncula]CAR65328.1 survivin-like [Suberites domuncula]